MPKFYRQNKKKIDPRYFLNETTNRDLDEAAGDRIGIDASFENLRTDLLSMMDRYLNPKQGKIVDTLLKQLDKFKCGRVKVDRSVPSLNPQDIEQLASLASDNIPRFFEIAAMLQKADDSDEDTDNDGIPDEQELAIVDKGEI